MRVKLKAKYCGPRGSFKPGQILDLPDAEGKQLVASKYAVVAGKAKAETADDKAVEKRETAAKQ